MNGRTSRQDSRQHSQVPRFFRSKGFRTRNSGKYSRTRKRKSKKSMVVLSLSLISFTTGQAVLTLRSSTRARRASTSTTATMACGAALSTLLSTAPTPIATATTLDPSNRCSWRACSLASLSLASQTGLSVSRVSFQVLT